MDSLRAPLAALEAAGVQYVLVGGLAVVLQGFQRLTVDVDLVVALDKLNAQKAVSALQSLGLVPRVPVDPQEFTDADQRARWIKEKGMNVFTMIHPANPFVNVDLFVEPPIPYESLILRADRLDIGDLTVTVCGIDDIIAMKRLAGRTQDLTDIEALSRIKDERSES